MINYLIHNEIDKTKWDICINTSQNCHVYALSWYLDIVSPGWEALVEDDYKAVMPLTCKKRMGINYLIQPILSQQLGVFSKDNNVNVVPFINSIPGKFKYINITFHKNSNSSVIFFSKKKTQELSLNNNYEFILRNYSRRTRRNLKSANEHAYQIRKNMTPEEFVAFKCEYSNPSIKNNERNIISQLIQKSIDLNCGYILALKNNKDEYVSCAYYIEYQKKLYFSITASSDEGKKNSAMFIILDIIIRESAGKFDVLDFTGSALPGVNYFNSGFGAQETFYNHIIINKLPWPLRFLKK